MPRAAAFFDLDRTLVACNTGRLFLADLRRRGEISLLRALRAMAWMAKYHFSLVDIDRVANKVAEMMKGHREEDFAARCRVWVAAEVTPRLLPAALRRVEQHRSEGHLVAILSTSPCYVVRPLCDALGIDEAVATRLEVREGLFTGRLEGPACFGRGKVHWAEDLVRRREIDLGGSWFYTDSYSDLPMLERVGHRVVVNPDPRLRRAAGKRGWPVEAWLETAA